MGATENSAADAAVQSLQSKSSTKSADGTAASPGLASRLTDSVGFGGVNATDDVFQVSSALSANGLMDGPVNEFTPEVGSKLITAQQNMGDGLKPDGLVNPGGPTEQRYTGLVQNDLMQAPGVGPSAGGLGTGVGSAVNPAQPAGPAPSRPATGNRAANASITAGIKQAAVDDARKQAAINTTDPNRTSHQQVQDVKRVEKAKQDAAQAEVRAERLESERRQREQREQLKAAQRATREASQRTQRAAENIQSVAKKAAGTLDTLLSGTGAQATTKPPVSAEAFQAHGRAAKYLGDKRRVGDYPRFVADAIETGEPKGSGLTPGQAVAEGADLISQIADRNPARAQEFYEKTVQGISPSRRADLDGALRHQDLPEGTLRHAIARKDDVHRMRTLEWNRERDGEGRMVLLGDADQAGSADGKQDPSGQDPLSTWGIRRPAEPFRLRSELDAAHGAEQSTAPPNAGSVSGSRMDEHGNWFDAKGNPIANPNADPNVQKTAAQAIPIILGAGVLGAGATQHMMDNPPKLPDLPGFPADPDIEIPNATPGQSTEPDRVIDPPDYVPPPTGAETGNQPFPDQSDDPDINGATLLDMSAPGPRDFILTKEKKLDFGEIPKDIETTTGGRFPAKPIRVQRGEPGRDKWGKLHVESDPKKPQRIRGLGYENELDMIEDVSANYAEVYEQENGSLLLVKPNGRNRYGIV